MQLLIDFGNTRIKWATLEQGKYSYAEAAPYREAALEGQMRSWWGELPAPVAIHCASVTTDIFNRQLDDWCRQQWQRPVTWLWPAATQLGVSNAYARPETLGSDRWAALLAARRLSPGDVGVIDCGSAITIDLLRADGRHEGGYIVPGLWLMQHCLLRGTGRIEATPAVSESSEPGTSSEACIRRGATRAALGLLESVMQTRSPRDVGPREWLLTGGDAPLLQSLLADRCRVVPDLVLRGLACIAEADE